MTTSHIFPAINVRDTQPRNTRLQKRKTITGRTAHGNPAAKYDHWKMLMDRLSGMTWDAVAEKHGVVGTKKSARGLLAKKVAMNSKAALKLSPDQVKRISDLGIPGRPPGASKSVVSNGMRWTIYSVNEREITVDGRYFFAARCSPERLWLIHEGDAPAQTNTSRILRWFDRRYKTRELTQAIADIIACNVPERAPNPPRAPNNPAAKSG